MKPLAVVLVVGVFTLVGGISWRAWQVGNSQNKLCSVLYRSISRSGATVGKPGTPGYAYYRTHLAELQAAHQQNKRFLNQLPC